MEKKSENDVETGQNIEYLTTLTAEHRISCSILVEV